MNGREEQLETIDLDELDDVGGGAGVKTALKKGGKFLLKKAGPVGAAYSAYEGISAGVKSYKAGNGAGTVLKDAALGAVW